APSRVVGKAILYAPTDTTFPASGPWSVPPSGEMPAFADIPAPGADIQAGHPVLTLLAEADDEDACMKALRLRAEEVERLLWPDPRSRSEGIRPVTGGQFTP